MCLRLEKLSMAPPGWASGFTLWDGALCEAQESIRDQLDKKLEPGKGALREAEESIRAALCKAGESIRGDFLTKHDSEDHLMDGNCFLRSAVRESEKCIRGDVLIKHDSEDHLMDGICFLMSTYKRAGKSSFNNVIRYLKANDEGEELSKGPNEADRNFAHKRETLISGVYSADASGESEAVKLKMEHCAKLSLGNNWKLEVKVCVQDSKINQKKKLWVDIKELYPDAIIEMSKNSTEVTLNSPKENHQFAVFGTPDTIDKKRMQLGLFGEKPVTGKNWKILSILFDDTVMAYQHVRKAEKARGRQLLTTLAGFFVSNSDQDIEINFRDVELGWKVKDGKPKIIRSKDAWNSPEDCTDFPRCFIEISHEDIKKRSFTFALIVSHEHDYAETEVIAYYEDPVKGNQGHIEQGQKP